MQIPRGMVSTYGDIARAVGRPHSARAVGSILRTNPHPIVVPCHRVVHTDGRLGGYCGADGWRRKGELLISEGVSVVDGCVENLSRFRFRKFRA